MLGTNYESPYYANLFTPLLIPISIFLNIYIIKCYLDELQSDLLKSDALSPFRSNMSLIPP